MTLCGDTAMGKEERDVAGIGRYPRQKLGGGWRREERVKNNIYVTISDRD